MRAAAHHSGGGWINDVFLCVQLQQREAGRRLVQQEVAAAVMRDHDYAVNSAVFTEEQTLDHNYTPAHEQLHPFGSRRFASSDKEIQFHTGYVWAGPVRRLTEEASLTHVLLHV